MRTFVVVALLPLLLSCKQPGSSSAGKTEAESPTLQLCRENPRYLSFRGKPQVLITSAEHYGALINGAFDYEAYLKALSAEGFNYTRIFTGTYVEPVENMFHIRNNTLAPEQGNFIAPWNQVDGKYDLEAFNPAYFERLKHFMEVAEREGVFVEVTLFSSIYAEGAWELCPFHPENNLQGVGAVPFKQVNTLDNGGLKPYQEAFVRELVRQLNGFDAFFFEIQNEPWSDNGRTVATLNQGQDRVFSRPWQKQVDVATEASLDWQAWIAGLIREEEKALEKQHLIAQNICNFQHKLDQLPAHADMVNFHYALPEAAWQNLELGGLIGLDETGFMPQEDSLYLDQAWRLMLSGAGLYNNLDYSFTSGYEKGDRNILPGNPGWGGPTFRKKLSYLVKALAEVPFHRMEVRKDLVSAQRGLGQYALALEGETYLLFLEGLQSAALHLDVPEGSYEIQFIDVDTGERVVQEARLGEDRAIALPRETTRLALFVKSKHEH